MNPEAQRLNEILVKINPTVESLLSQRGKSIFFPKKGILGQTAEAKGVKYNATIGMAIEDDNSPMRLPSLSKQTELAPEQVFPYSPSFGNPEIRSVWKDMLVKKNPSLNGISISKPVVTNALTHALSTVGYLFCNEGDTIILPDLYWGNYNLTFSQAYNTLLETYTLFNEDGLNMEAFNNAVLDSEPGKKIVLLNFPNNPSGYTPTADEADAIAATLKTAAEKGNQLAVFIDDAYFGLVYEANIAKESLFAKLANLHENLLAVKLDGPTKEDYVWGFRVGFITYGIKGGTEELYEALEAKTAGAIRGNISNVCTLSQNMLLNAFKSDTYPDEKKSKFDILQERYTAVRKVLDEKKEYTKYFKALPFNSGYFMCIKLTDGIDPEAVRQLLISKYSTGLINLAGTLRVAFSSVSATDIEPLFDNIYNACTDIMTLEQKK